MSRLVNSLCVPFAVILCGIGTSGASAALLDSHAFAGMYINAPGEYNSSIIVKQEGDGPLDTGLHSFEHWNPLVHTTRSAQAKTDISTGRFLKSYASASGSHAGTFVTYGVGQGLAAWRDVVLGSDPTVPIVRLNFRFDGDLGASKFSGDPVTNNWAEFGIRTSTDPGTFFEEQVEWDFGRKGGYMFDYEAVVYAGNQSGTTKAPGYVSDGEFSAASGHLAWDSFSYDGAHFTGSFHIDSAYDDSLGGYGWGVSLSSRARGRGGEAEADAMGTLTLQQVTLTDGTPLDVTFDSGLQFAPPSSVPEPTSLLTWSGLTLMGLVTARRRRMRRAS